MKKLFLLFVLCSLSSKVFSKTLFQDEVYDVYIGGNLAGYGIYNTTNENFLDKELYLSSYGDIQVDASAKNSDSIVGTFLKADFNSDNDYMKKQFYVSEAYLYLEGSYGRFELGKAKNIARKIHFAPPDVGILNIDETWGLNYLLQNNNFNYIDSTAITMDYNTEKVNYISPSILGFQIAGSYIPKARNLDTYNIFNYGQFKNGFIGALKYSYENNGNFGISLAYGQFNEAENIFAEIKRREEFSIGSKYYIKGLQLSASYKTIKEDNEEGIVSQEGYSFSYGLAYEIGPFSVSLTNHQSNIDNLISNNSDDILNLSLLSTKYALSKYINLALSIGRIAYESENNVSSVGMLSTTGILVNF